MKRAVQFTAPQQVDVAEHSGASPRRALGRSERRRLRREARRVLYGNWTGTSTVPSRSLYPHQWTWDSAFIAIGLRHLSAVACADGSWRRCSAAQWGDGRIPHIVFNPRRATRTRTSPGPDFWRSSTAGARRRSPADAWRPPGIVQPPVHALAAWLVHQADPGSLGRRGFLTRIRPRLAAWHRYLAAPPGPGRRRTRRRGAPLGVRAWTTALAGTPRWRVSNPPRPAPSGAPTSTTGPPRTGPRDLDYGRYVRLAADYRDGGYRDARNGDGDDGGHPRPLRGRGPRPSTPCSSPPSTPSPPSPANSARPGPPPGARRRR